MASDPQFDMKPIHVDLTFVKVDITADNTLPPIQLRKPTAKEQAAEGRRVMACLRRMGHRCNEGCRPPFAHMSDGAFEAVAKYLSEKIEKAGA